MLNSRKEFHFKVCFGLILCLGSGFATAQNLAPNGSFNEGDSAGFAYWQKSGNVSVYSYTSDEGENRAAILIADVQGKVPNSTTYIFGGEQGLAVKLKEPLAAETFYKISLKVRQADSSLLILNNLGLYFAKKKEPDALLSLGEVNISEEWRLLEDVYFARGGEQFLFIGKMSDADIKTDWNTKFKRKKYQSQWHLNKDGYRHEARYVIDDVVLEKVPWNISFTVGSTFVPENILFETAKAELSGEAESYLLMLASFLKARKDVLISVEGFADERGASEYNEQLSKKRAIGVANSLLRNGVAKNRIKVEWHGSEKAKSTEPQYHLDRKVQLELVSRD